LHAAKTNTALDDAIGDGQVSGDSGVGIDVEHCDNLPAAADPQGDPFYLENFTPAEIGYCQRQPKPRESFCGLWCAKEAAKKCSAEFVHLRPLELEITHDAQGRPLLAVLRDGKQETKRNCVLSISHSNGLAVAVCVMGAGGVKLAGSGLGSVEKPAGSGGNALAWLAFGLGLLDLVLWLWLVLEKREK
jgi:phosphopantetheine--protein transferase-like protein